MLLKSGPIAATGLLLLGAGLLSPGCVSVPPQHRAAYARVQEKQRTCVWHKAHQGDVEIAFGYYVVDRQQPWLDPAFDRLDFDLLDTIFGKVACVAQEEAPYCGLMSELFSRNQPSFTPIVRQFINASQQAKVPEELRQGIRFLLSEYGSRQVAFETARYNRIDFHVCGLCITFQPRDLEGRKCLWITVEDGASGRPVGDPENNRCYFLCDYRGQVLQTVPERRNEAAGQNAMSGGWRSAANALARD